MQIIDSPDRTSLLVDLPKKVASSGPYDGFLVRMGNMPYGEFDSQLLEPLAAHCKIIVSASAGFNEFDVPWMTSKGIYFCNTRNAVAEATADMALFLILAVLKDASATEKHARDGNWRGPNFTPTVDPNGLKLGIVGMGSIGKYIAKKAQVFGMDVVYYNRTRLAPEIESLCGASYCGTLHELLGVADVVSISCPLNKETTGLISTKEFEKMKHGVFFVNTSRGAVIDEAALIAALESGKVRRAGLDVFAEEPKIDEYFRSSNKCTIQPHLGGLTDGSYRRAERECLENLREFFQSGKPVAAVNEIN